MIQECFKTINDLSDSKSQKFLYSFAYIHKYLLNDEQNFFNYLQQRKQIIDMKKLLKQNYQMENQESEFGMV